MNITKNNVYLLTNNVYDKEHLLLMLANLNRELFTEQ